MSTLLRNPLPQGGKDKSLPRGGALILSAFLLLAAASPAPAALCGNGTLDPGETCDDGNTSGRDCCSPSCGLLDCPSTAASPVRWQELGPFSLGGRVSALAASPQDPRILYAGTPAAGVWRSDDGGRSWTGVARWLGSLPVSALAVDPRDPDIVLLGTGAISEEGAAERSVGILRTTDGGLSWAYAADGWPAPYVASLRFWDDEPERVLAATEFGIRLSRDGGASFREVLVGRAFSALAQDPFDAEGAYAAGPSGLYGSADRGETWSELAPWPVAPSAAALAVSHQTPGLLYAAVRVPAAPDRVLLLRSSDGGESFEELVTAPAIGALALDPWDDRRLLLGGARLRVSTDAGATWSEVGGVAGVHAILLQADGAVVAGASGVARLDASWSTASPRNDGLAVTSIVSLDASPYPPQRLLAGTADSGSLLGVGEVPGWRVIFGEREPAGAARFNPFDPDRLYVSQPRGRFYRSDDGGSSFQPILDPPPGGERVPLEPSPLVPATLFAGGVELVESVDAGDSWSPLAAGGSAAISQIAASPADAGRLYFARSEGGDVYLLDGTYAERRPISAEPDLRVTSLFVDPDHDNVLYAALTHTTLATGRVFKSHDSGASWHDVTPPNLAAAHSIVKDPSGALYLGTDEGVWRSANDGFTWYPFNAGLTASGVRALRLADGALFAGTAGRGVFRLPLRDYFSIDAILPGQRLLVDGELVTAPFLADWHPRSAHTVGVYLVQTADTREEFVSWSDGGPASHRVDAVAGNASLTAAVRRLYRLRIDAPTGGTLVADPPSPDGFYESQRFVTLLAVPAADHRFVRFTGELSGRQEGLGYALMDRPRRVSAEFEPLEIEITSDPPGLELTVDGEAVTTPVSYRWAAGSEHRVSAPEVVDSGDLAFDGWSDLLPREHGFTVRRDPLITELMARYIPVVPELGLDAGGAALLGTAGVRAAPRVAALTLRSAPGDPVPASLQIVRGAIGGALTTELVLAPSAPQGEIHAFVEGGGRAGRVRLEVHNPWPQEVFVDLWLRDPDGADLARREHAFAVPATGRASRFLDEVLELPEVFAGHLTIVAARGLVVSLPSVRGNLRPSGFIDPILVVPFLAADQGVPRDPRIQALWLTPDTEHRLALVNPGTAELSGRLRILDEAGRPLALAEGASANRRYALPPGGYRVLRGRARNPSGTGQVRIVPDAGQSAPWIQLLEERTVGASVAGPLTLPRSLPPSRSTTRFAVPVERAMRDSGVILTHRGAADVAVEFALRDVDGVELGARTSIVPAGGQIVVFSRELFAPLPDSFRGFLRGSSPAAVGAVGVLRQLNPRGEEVLAGFPVVDLRDKGSPRYYAYAVDGDSWSSEWWFLNHSAAPSTVNLAFRGEGGETRYLPMEER